MRKFLFLFLLLPLTGCGSLTPWTKMASTPQYRDSSRKFSATVPDGWMRFNPPEYFLLTRDGVALNVIIVERHRVDRKLESTKKLFQVDLTPQEIADVEIDDLGSDPKLGHFEVLSNTPVTVAGRPGFRLEYTYSVVETGLKKRGIHYGTMVADKDSGPNKEKHSWVYRIRFEAPQQYYFEKHKEVFEAFEKSLQLIDDN